MASDGVWDSMTQVEVSELVRSIFSSVADGFEPSLVAPGKMQLHLLSPKIVHVQFPISTHRIHNSALPTVAYRGEHLCSMSLECPSFCQNSEPKVERLDTYPVCQVDVLESTLTWCVDISMTLLQSHGIGGQVNTSACRTSRVLVEELGLADVVVGTLLRVSHDGYDPVVQFIEIPATRVGSFIFLSKSIMPLVQLLPYYF